MAERVRAKSRQSRSRRNLQGGMQPRVASTDEPTRQRPTPCCQCHKSPAPVNRERQDQHEKEIGPTFQGKSNHVTQLFSAGHTRDLNYIVMSLLGKTLLELKKNTPGDRFSVPTVLLVGQQMVQSLKDLHSIGYLHRDIKPANFAVDLPKNRRHGRSKVYIFDFGLCRSYKRADGRLRQRRDSASFRGTVRYASADVLAGKDMGRNDDLWSMFYVLSEMVNSQLPWRRIADKEVVFKLKQSTPPDQLWRSMPGQTRNFVDHLRGLDFYSTPDYPLINETFDLALRSCQNNDEEVAFDWEVGGVDDGGKGGDEAAGEDWAQGDGDDKSLADGRSN